MHMERPNRGEAGRKKTTQMGDRIKGICWDHHSEAKRAGVNKMGEKVKKEHMPDIKGQSGCNVAATAGEIIFGS